MREAYGGVLGCDFGINKTIEILKECFYCVKMTSDVYKIICKYSICHRAKSLFQQGLYTSLRTLNGPWDGFHFRLAKDVKGA